MGAGRLDSCVALDHHIAKNLPQKPSDYLKMFYYDAIAYHTPSLQAVGDFAGWDRLMFGTDHPFFSPLEGKEDPATRWASVDKNYKAMQGLASAERSRMIACDNAYRILGIPRPAIAAK